jgi:hypothetical protein
MDTLTNNAGPNDFSEETPYTSVYSSPLLKVPAHFFSVIFHPIFLPLYVMFFIVFVHPGYMAGFSMADKKQVLLIIMLNAVLFPLFTVLLLRALKFIDSFYLKTRRDRIIPYIACGIFFFWSYIVFKQQTQYPTIIPAFMLGVFLSSSLALLANIYFKISMHAIGAGGLIGIFFIIMRSNSMLMTWPLCLALLIAGIVCTSRLIVSNHTQREIYLGLAAGIVCQFAAALVVL